MNPTSNTNQHPSLGEGLGGLRVHHPTHYTSHPSGIECIDIVRHFSFSVGNVIKYLWRAGLKQEQGMTDLQKELEDCRKAQFYLEDHIKQLELKLMRE